MNYLWDVFYEQKADCRFIQPQTFSPYLESVEEKKEEDGRDVISVNGFYRYEEIMTALYQNAREFPAFDKEREKLFDVLMHYLAFTEMKSGTSRRGILVKHLLEELEQGCYGNKAKKLYENLQWKERESLGQFMWIQEQAGSSLSLFRKVMKVYFPQSAVYKGKGEKAVILLYVGRIKNAETEAVLEGIKELFLPLGYPYRIFWGAHFGVFGSQATMEIGNIEIY